MQWFGIDGFWWCRDLACMLVHGALRASELRMLLFSVKMYAKATRPLTTHDSTTHDPKPTLRPFAHSGRRVRVCRCGGRLSLSGY